MQLVRTLERIMGFLALTVGPIIAIGLLGRWLWGDSDRLLAAAATAGIILLAGYLWWRLRKLVSRES